MNRIRKIAGGLLLLTGILHVAATTTITVAFGIAYLTIGVFLFRGRRNVLYLGTVIPLIGMLLATISMFITPTTLGAVFIFIDVAIVACCAYLIANTRKEQTRT